MELNTQDELKAHLMATDERFRNLVQQHQDYSRKVESMEAAGHLSDQEQMEHVRLKKLKLRLKDEMMEMLSRHRAQTVS